MECEEWSSERERKREQTWVVTSYKQSLAPIPKRSIKVIEFTKKDTVPLSIIICNDPRYHGRVDCGSREMVRV